MCGSAPPSYDPIKPPTQPFASAVLKPLTEEQVALRSRRNTSDITEIVRRAIDVGVPDAAVPSGFAALQPQRPPTAAERAAKKRGVKVKNYGDMLPGTGSTVSTLPHPGNQFGGRPTHVSRRGPTYTIRRGPTRALPTIP